MAAFVLVIALVALVFCVSYYWDRRIRTHDVTSHGPRQRTRFTLLTEASAYLGSTLVLIGTGVAIGQHWNAIGDWGHVAIFAGGAAFFLVAGLGLTQVAEPAVQRVLGVVWFLSIASAATATGVATHDMFGGSWAQTAMTVGLAVTACSAVLWLARRREPELVALFIGLTVAVCGAILTAAGPAAPWLAFALGLWMLGLGWAVLGWRYPEPLWTTVPLAAALALLAPSLAVWTHGWAYAIGVATALAAMAASVPLRNSLLLAGGTISLFGYLTAMVVRYFQSSIGLPATLTIAGVLLLALAVVTAVLNRAARDREETGERTTAEVPTAELPTAEVPTAELPTAELPKVTGPRKSTRAETAAENEPDHLRLPKAS
ncbi:MAG TPA: hypothetical protein VF834_12465 [Streptosporangiaceae bacterium]